MLVELQENLDDEKAAAREWPYEGVYRDRKTRQIPLGYRVGGTAISTWALIESKDWTQHEARRAAVNRSLDFLFESLDKVGMSEFGVELYDVRSWGLCYALTLFTRLEAQTRVDAATLSKERLEKIQKSTRELVRRLSALEIRGTGGWHYSQRGMAPATFLTASVLLSFYRARDLGYEVDAQVVKRALDSLRDARLHTGAFQYASRPRQKTGRSIEAVPGSVGRMPVCEVALHLAGRSEPRRIEKSLVAFFDHWKWLERRRKKNGTHQPPYMIAPYYFFYAHLYAAKAIEFLPQSRRDHYREKLFDLLKQVKDKDGTWNDRVFPRSRAFGTAASVLALLEPDLPRAPKWAPKPESPPAPKGGPAAPGPAPAKPDPTSKPDAVKSESVKSEPSAR